MPMVKRSQYIRIENPLNKHFAGMPMVGGEGSKIEKICRRLKWMVPKGLLLMITEVNMARKIVRLSNFKLYN